MINLYIPEKSIKEKHLIYPESKNKIDAELNSILNKIKSKFKNDSKIILRINFYYNSIDNDYSRQISEFELKFRNDIKSDCPLVFIPQRPYNFEVVAEILSISVNESEYNVKFDSSTNKFYRIEYDNNYEVYGFATSMDCQKTVFDNARNCFEQIDSILDAHSLKFNNIVRQWNYIGFINEEDNFNNYNYENYQLFNLARAEHYSRADWKLGYPSATGIGMSLKGCIIEFAAHKVNDENHIIALHNPLQEDAHKYSERYIPLIQNDNTPKFERGKIAVFDKYADVYVSGTAAIIGEDSIENNCEKQTIITIDNIKSLLSIDNLYKHNVGFESEISNFNLMRCYVKHISDSEIAQKIITNRYPDCNLLIVEADICRKELLVEIEAKLFACK